ncbi:DUF1972 domain-containing protein [Agromyces sp. NPDC058484]|uniref:DUF1972 domain-containing protein n=1 Tax=Agromyces sp. NPDC058484 TaxID=3346524 RepID=UPI00364B67CC
MIGTRGVPAAYGGFETAVEEIGRRLVDRGHRVTVYCRSGRVPPTHLGMHLVRLPALRLKAAETLSHTALSVGHVAVHHRPDVAFVFNAANAPFVPMLHARGIPTAVHVDGLEWQRDKWGGAGRRYYRHAEQSAVRWSDALIADAEGIAEYYRSEFDVPTELLAYGASILRETPSSRLTELGLRPEGYHLVVARFEPENHVDVIVDGYARSTARQPLVVVGSAPYAAAHTQRIRSIAANDPRIRLLGPVWDQELLDQLYTHATSYVHGHSVGGTNPSLLRAMGAGTAVIAWDVVFNRDVAGPVAAYFDDAESLCLLVEDAELNPQHTLEAGESLRARAASRYVWDAVATGYEQLARRLIAGYSTRGPDHPRTNHSAWSAVAPHGRHAQAALPGGR